MKWYIYVIIAIAIAAAAWGVYEVVKKREVE